MYEKKAQTVHNSIKSEIFKKAKTAFKQNKQYYKGTHPLILWSSENCK